MVDKNDISALRRILGENKTVAVVGLSAKWHRPSFFAAKYMQEHGYKVVPVNPGYVGQTILGEPCYGSLEDIPHAVDMVDCFRRSEDIEPIAKSAVQIKAKVLWLQLGVLNQRAEKIAVDSGLDFVCDRCVKIEHGRLFGGLNWVGVNTKVISSKRPRTFV